jgi:hypothetical protein
VSETATMTSGTAPWSVPASGATMVPAKDEKVVFVQRSTLLAGVLAVTMLSPPAVAAASWSRLDGGDTVNRDLAFAEDSALDEEGLDLDAQHMEMDLAPLPVGFRLAELAPVPPFIDPGLLLDD